MARGYSWSEKRWLSWDMQPINRLGVWILSQIQKLWIKLSSPRHLARKLQSLYIILPMENEKPTPPLTAPVKDSPKITSAPSSPEITSFALSPTMVSFPEVGAFVGFLKMMAMGKALKYGIILILILSYCRKLITLY